MRANGLTDRLNSRVGTTRDFLGQVVLPGNYCVGKLCQPTEVCGHPSEECGICGKTM
jgi:hypothetical protein